MVGAQKSILVLLFLSTILLEINGQESTAASLKSPCPNVFKYETKPNENDRWYGVISFGSNKPLTKVKLEVLLNKKADLLGNWYGKVVSRDNTLFTIGKKDNITPGEIKTVRLFVKYSEYEATPIVKEIRLNGENICKDQSHVWELIDEK